MGSQKKSIFLAMKNRLFQYFLLLSSKVFWHVTQNVDSLLTKAGCELLSELHGCSARVVCVDCGYKSLTREELQEIILNQNPNWTAQSNTINPDADVHLTEEQLGDFQVDENVYILNLNFCH